ncbi:unnamed protein product [Ixodes persulcatus]
MGLFVRLQKLQFAQHRVIFVSSWGNITTLRCCHDAKISLGHVSINTKKAKHEELVPVKFLDSTQKQSVLQHLRWMMQKDALGQDIFLIGPPGAYRRRIAFQYLELTRREVEYVALTRDTTETDLKQRREIQQGASLCIDQAAVKAATEGRILVLEGVEKAERNVLPVLNNLLENREMQLDDGRFLVSPARYDKLLASYSKETLDSWKLVRVSEDFRVFALGVPVPPFRGNPLDPPFRSRFQVRKLENSVYKEQLEGLIARARNVPEKRLSSILSFVHSLLASKTPALILPDFPIDSLETIADIMQRFPSASFQSLLARIYPEEILTKEGKKAVQDALAMFNLADEDGQSKSKIEEAAVSSSDLFQRAIVSVAGNKHTVEVNRGSLLPNTGAASAFITTPYHENLLAEMLMSHSAYDICLIGSKGCGKTALVKQFASLLGYEQEVVLLYQDMGSRDLVQQRTTLADGNTTWIEAPLVTAALEGKMAVLDGIHRLHPSTISQLQRLTQDRELQLFDGKRLLRHDRYDAIKSSCGFSDGDMKTRQLYRIHPSFRIVALAEPPSSNQKAKQEKWLTPEILPMFLFHSVRSLSLAEERTVIESMVGKLGTNMEMVLKIAHQLRVSDDATLQSIAGSLSTRQLLRIAHRLAKYPDLPVVDTVYKACLAQFLPPLAKQALERELQNAGLDVKTMPVPKALVRCEVKDGMVVIGDTKMDVYKAGDSQVKVPDTLFYDNQQHAVVLEAMLQDFLLGEHLLLVGNQGVGKNKIVDRFLFLLNWPREYVQLHRDTSVQSLTLQPTVKGGVIVYEDSPLVKAVQNGHILVVDEADKAPTHVTCILKALVESGEMLLADGRRIVHYADRAKAKPNSVVMHPNFRMIVLANRPGFPFLGNDFFGSLGDIFSCHAVDNPSKESEMALLKQYGPSVPTAMLEKLVAVFGDLRHLSDEGLIAYPFSTREVVNVVKHLESFPDDGIASVLRNVFDFDSYNKEIRKTLLSVLHKHGIPVDADPEDVHLSKVFKLPSSTWVSKWSFDRADALGLEDSCSVDIQDLHVERPTTLAKQSADLEKTEARSMFFSELQHYWSLPYGASTTTLDLAVSKSEDGSAMNDTIHIAAKFPLGLYSFSPRHLKSSYLLLQQSFPSGYTSETFRLAALGGSLQGCLVLHESLTNMLLLLDPETGDASRINLGSLTRNVAERFVRSVYNSNLPSEVCLDLVQSNNLLAAYQPGRSHVSILDLENRSCVNWKLPVSVNNVLMLDPSRCIITAGDTNRRYLLSWDQEKPRGSHVFSQITETSLDGGLQAYEVRHPYRAAQADLPLETLRSIVGPDGKATSAARLLLTQQDFATVALKSPGSEHNWEVHSYPRSSLPWGEQTVGSAHEVPRSALLQNSTLIVTSKGQHLVPKEAWPENGAFGVPSAFLEAVDVNDQTIRYVPVPLSRAVAYRFQDNNTSDIVMDVGSNDTLVTADRSGCVQVWELSAAKLKSSLAEWHQMIGANQTPLELKIEKRGKQATGPKHGKEDPENMPHVGGNTWAGGTGGTDTAGLGGAGGPYRLDKGHRVHQLSDMDKQSVPPEVLQAAREMAQKALKSRLKEIDMSEHDAALYEQFSGSVQRQVQLLRVILDGLQATSKERQWLKHQSSGDLDDSKLIESITGEKTIYRKRGEQEPEIGSPQVKPKRLRLVVDVSGSMYRFNGYDSRLEREMEAVLMVMEALQGFQNKFVYDILGHSGEESRLDLVKADKPPTNDKERFKVLQEMHAHSQFCMSGDNTLSGTREAIESVVGDECEQHFVIVLSDANLERYAIPAKSFAQVLTSNPEVDAFAVFIGSLGDQAARLQKRLPAGRAFVCLDTSELPQILQQIFTSSLLRSSS